MRVFCALLGTVAAWLQPVQPPRRHVLRRHLLEKPADVASTPPATGVSTLVLLRHGESVWNVKDDERLGKAGAVCPTRRGRCGCARVCTGVHGCARPLQLGVGRCRR